MPNDEMKARLAQIIDAISAGAYTLSNAASEVLKELSDSPAWLQTNENSIETYRMRYGKLPLMPLSSALWFLKAVPAAGADERLFPRHTLGTPEFKMLYGARQLLAKSTPVTFAEMPSVRASLEAYNGVSAKREQIDEARYLKFVQGVVSALRYVTDVRSVRTQLSTTGRQHRFAPGDFNMAGSGIGNDNTVYALSGASIQDVLTLTESSNQDEQAQKLSARVHVQTSRTHTATGRKLERTLNLIDMNIIPINVHALMRDIPLANLYNYEYTFEQMAASLFGEQMTAYDGAATNTRRMFLQLLADPYLQVTADQFGSDQYADPREGYLHRIFRGDNNLGMNRPKFLSDQLFNKALFGSVYQSRADWDEAGPSTGIGMARGFQWTEQDRLLAQSMLVQLSAAERNFPTGLAAVPAPAPQPPQRVWAPSGPRFSTPALQTAVTNEGAAHTAYAGTIAAGPTIAQFNAYGAALRTLIATLQAVVRAPRADHPAQRRSALTFLDSSADAADTADRVVEVAIPAADKAALETIGRGRFDTHFVRNMMFVTNVVRLLRLKLNRELTQSRNVVLSSHLAVAPSVTEYGSDPYGPNETSGSQQWMDQRR